jgi:YHS domain-containing protein
MYQGETMTAIDPVCGMEVEESTAEWKTTYQGQTYYFCAPGCLRSFQKEPAKYAPAQAGGEPEQHQGHAHDHDHGK